MIKSYNGFYIVVWVLFTTFMLTSCVSDKTGSSIVEEQEVGQQKSAGQKFSAWNPEEFSEDTRLTNRAVKALLNQVDVLISYNALEQASSKLERLLRIEPTYAPAWSRLSWLALRSGLYGRARQMAHRSNSYAHDNNKLKVLNWSFIRQASQKMNDVEETHRAERMIEELEEV